MHHNHQLKRWRKIWNKYNTRWETSGVFSVSYKENNVIIWSVSNRTESKGDVKTKYTFLCIPEKPKKRHPTMDAFYSTNSC